MTLVVDGPTAAEQGGTMRGLGLHGQAVAATVGMIQDLAAQEPDLDQIARRIGVSRDELNQIFHDKQALFTAVAEQALVRLMDSCAKSVVKEDPNDPLAQFQALGRAYLCWADNHKVQFRMISSHPSLNLARVPELRRYLDAIMDLMKRMLERARDRGQLRQNEDIPMLVLSSRIFAHGLAQMVIDGRTDAWMPDVSPLEAAEQAFSDFVQRIAPAPVGKARNCG